MNGPRIIDDIIVDHWHDATPVGVTKTQQSELAFSFLDAQLVSLRPVQ